MRRLIEVIHNICKEKGYKIIDDYNEGKVKEIDKVCFIYKEDGVWVGIDNNSGDAWTEEFERKEDCIAWLKGEIDLEDYALIKLIRKCKTDEVKNILNEIIDERNNRIGVILNKSKKQKITEEVNTLKQIQELLNSIDEYLVYEEGM